MAYVTLSKNSIEGNRSITLQVKGFLGDLKDEEEFRVLLHDGIHWIKASVNDTYRRYIQEQNMPDAFYLVVTRATFGGPDNLLIVRISLLQFLPRIFGQF